MGEESVGLTTTRAGLPATFEELTGMAKAFVASGMFQDVKQMSQAIVKIQAGKELGLPPVYSMQNINMIRDRLTCSANTMAMLVKKSGCYNYRMKEHTDLVCTIAFFEREGDKWVEVGESTFSMEDAARAGLVKAGGGWEKYPRAMLFSRAISQGARIYCPDAIGGIYTDEEIRSIPPRPGDVTPEDTPEEITPEPEASDPEVPATPDIGKKDESVVSDDIQNPEAPESKDAPKITAKRIQAAAMKAWGLESPEVNQQLSEYLKNKYQAASFSVLTEENKAEMLKALESWEKPPEEIPF